MISTATQRWGRMDFAISQRCDISATAKVVYAVLKCYENEETGRCDPTQTMIADDAGASIISVKRAIKQLVEARIIEVDRTPGSSRYAYRMTDQRRQNGPSQIEQNARIKGTKCPHQGDKMIPPWYQNDTSLYNNRTEKRRGCARS